MKNRLLYLLIACVLSISMVACGTTDEEKNSQGTEDTSNTEEMPSMEETPSTENNQSGGTATTGDIEGIYWLFIDEYADEYDNYTCGYYFDGAGNYKYVTVGYVSEGQYKVISAETTEEGVTYMMETYKDGDPWGEIIVTLSGNTLTEMVDFGDGAGGTFVYKAVDEKTFSDALK